MTDERLQPEWETRTIRGMKIARGAGRMVVEGIRDEMDEGTVMDFYTRDDGDVSLQLTPPVGAPLEITFAGPNGGSRHDNVAHILRYIPRQLFEDEGHSPFLNEEVVSSYQEDLRLDAGNPRSLSTSVYGIKGDGGDSTVLDIHIQEDGDVIVVFKNPEGRTPAERMGYPINFNTGQGGTRIDVAGWAFGRIALCLAGKFPRR